MNKFVKFTSIHDLGSMLNTQMTDRMAVDKIHVIEDKISTEIVIEKMVECSREANEDPGPFMICNLNDIVKKYYTWIQTMPDITPFYAVKSNDSIPILRTLAALGTGFDCASEDELDKMLSLGVSPDRLILANTVKSPSHLRYAARIGIKKMTFDNEIELYKIAKLYPDADLLLRIACDDPNAHLPLSTKFGCDPSTEAYELLKIAKKLKLNIIGVSFHVGSGCTDCKIFETALQYTKQVFVLAKTLGYNMFLVDIGGGFPGEKGTSIKNFGSVINSAVQKYFSDVQNLKVISEPGRFFVMSSCTLVCMIYGKKKIKTKDEKSGKFKKQNMYYMNDGLYGTFSIYSMHSIVKMPKIVKKYQYINEKLIKSTIFGPTCDSMDKVLSDINLPELNIYDWLSFEDVGGYSFRAPQKFNGFPGPKHFYLLNKSNYNLLKDKYISSNDSFTFSE